MSEVKNKFIRDLIDELNDINECERVYYNKNPLNICFMVSVIEQQIEELQQKLGSL